MPTISIEKATELQENVEAQRGREAGDQVDRGKSDRKVESGNALELKDRGGGQKAQEGEKQVQMKDTLDSKGGVDAQTTQEGERRVESETAVEVKGSKEEKKALQVERKADTKKKEPLSAMETRGGIEIEYSSEAEDWSEDDEEYESGLYLTTLDEYEVFLTQRTLNHIVKLREEKKSSLQAIAEYFRKDGKVLCLSGSRSNEVAFKNLDKEREEVYDAFVKATSFLKSNAQVKWTEKLQQKLAQLHSQGKSNNTIVKKLLWDEDYEKQSPEALLRLLFLKDVSLQLLPLHEKKARVWTRPKRAPETTPKPILRKPTIERLACRLSQTRRPRAGKKDEVGDHEHLLYDEDHGMDSEQGGGKRAKDKSKVSGSQLSSKDKGRRKR